ncbi:MAG: lipoyl synthase [Acidobacteria bacterium]|nr:lipoyl synthase [Acidobacteriota bacterium]
MARRHPDWLKVRFPSGEEYRRVKLLLRRLHLHTVCESARCPNIGECFNRGVATFMILGDVCTRNCRFCNVEKGVPLPLDPEEPKRVAEAVVKLNLRYAVITSVTRDDLPDGGAGFFAETIKMIRKYSPSTRVEVLIPDFKGDPEALETVLSASPDVLNHNLETVRRLYPEVRPQADYERSLAVLKRAKEHVPSLLTKSGLMVGLGEDISEIKEAMADLRETGCDLLTLGQYLQPTPSHLPIARYYHPDEFRKLAREGMEMGFLHVEAGPLVRSSYRADLQFSHLDRGK